MKDGKINYFHGYKQGIKMGKSGLTRLLRSGAAMCGVHHQGTFNDMR